MRETLLYLAASTAVGFAVVASLYTASAHSDALSPAFVAGAVFEMNYPCEKYGGDSCACPQLHKIDGNKLHVAMEQDNAAFDDGRDWISDQDVTRKLCAELVRECGK